MDSIADQLKAFDTHREWYNASVLHVPVQQRRIVDHVSNGKHWPRIKPNAIRRTSQLILQLFSSSGTEADGRKQR